ncbi:unannotated protein [freshwater metagenome]|uniref:Unannotated protein n=1 Tax=freshwater metagenome TaxID=449393 RepID=A0A6J7EN88_9ZZZZ|nr:hypothetical protein [Actinomycetota bacterium]
MNTSSWVAGVYTLTVSYPSDARCTSASDSSTLITIAAPLAYREAEGGGRYEKDGKVTFGIEVEKRTVNKVATIKGDLVWQVNNSVRLKGKVSSRRDWSSVGSSVNFTVTIADGGTSKVCATRTSCKTTLKPDWFRMDIPGQTVPGESSSLIQINGGNIGIEH